MAPIAAAQIWSQARRRALFPHVLIAFGLMLAALLLPGRAAAQAVRGEAGFSATGGYGRLVIKLAQDVESDVAMAGLIVVVRFKRQVDIPVDKLADSAPGYIGSVRLDPDGMAMRLALTRKMTVNPMAAGERLFIDLLPETWSGAPPGLPTDVVKELTERARAAERALRAQRAVADVKKRPPIRVRTSVQPTFVRYVFETPADVRVSSTVTDNKLTVLFNAPLTFDLADAQLASPPSVGSISQKVDPTSATVELALIGGTDVHSFREDKNFIIDVGFQPAEGDVSKSGSSALTLRDIAKLAAQGKDAAAPKGDDHGKPGGEHTAHDAADAGASKPAVESKPAQAEQHAPPPKPEPRAVPAPSEDRPMSPAGPPPQAATAMPSPAGPAAGKNAQPIAGAAVSQAVVTPAGPRVAPAAIVPAAAAPEPTPVAPAPAASVAARPTQARRDADGLHLAFTFAAPTPAALFRRGEVLWLVFDNTAAFDLEAIRREGRTMIGDVSRIALPNGQAIRMHLDRPQLATLGRDDASGRSWALVLADAGASAPQPLIAVRNIVDPSRASVSVALPGLGQVHRLTDPEAGDALTIVTALPPPRGFIKQQRFVEFNLLESIHGVVVQAKSDDVAITAATDAVVLTRPGGLTLSAAEPAGRTESTSANRPFFDITQWNKDQEGRFLDRRNERINAAASANADDRTQARIGLARFYMARGFYHEAKGELDLALAGTKAGQEDPAAMIGHAAASALMLRPEQTLKDIANPAIASTYDAQLWRGVALARQGKWAEAREKLKTVQFAITALPLDIQREVLATALRASLEVKDYSGAAKISSDFDLVGVAPSMKPQVAVMRGRLDESLGRDGDALKKYKEAIASPDRQAAAEAKLRDIMLRTKREEIAPAEALPELERLSILWRGDDLEVRTQQLLSKLYADAGRFRESLAAAKISTQLAPNSEAARTAQDDARTLFAQLFLGQKGDDLPPIQALATFYEFRELTPIGRRGDEMIRRLADRLAAVDLLDQASELLQYQVDKRLEGAARAQVAARLAMIYLMNRKPDKAISALRSSRIADLNGELRQQRLLLEARAQSDVGRHDLALDILSNIAGREAIRLRSDVYWAARRWREASEQIELYLGERWKDFTPLSPAEKSDVIRTVVGYALADDALGLDRFRDKFAPLMTDAADRTAFDIASKPANGNATEFAAIAKIAAGVDTLEGFLREMKTRFPDASARATPPGADMNSTGSLPAIQGRKLEAPAAK